MRTPQQEIDYLLHMAVGVDDSNQIRYLVRAIRELAYRVDALEEEHSEAAS